MKKETYYVTTPIYYASGDLHLGHCYTTVLADACARFQRLAGKDVFFLTGSDEHGLKIARKAEEAGITPKEYTDQIVAKFKHVWSVLGITYDKFIRTTDEDHVKVVQKAFQKLYDQGDIYKANYEGLYCVPCESFFTESQVVDGKCPDCGRPVELMKEESYFFKMSKYTEWLKDFYQSHPDFLIPEARKNEIYKNFIENGVQDLCVSRTTFDWGVPVPFDSKHVMYVWIDALLNYVTALGYGTENDTLFQKFWPADVQFVGREIARFHAVIWPILLKALDLPLPKQIHSHGWITEKGDKMSKSSGNGFNPLVLADRYGTDAVRYWVYKDGPIFNDSPYSSELFIKTINADLCNDLGNLVSRTLAMITQNFDAKLPKCEPSLTEDKELENKLNHLYEAVKNAMDQQRVDMAIDEIFGVVRAANKYIDVTAPWILAKVDKNRLATVLYHLYESIRMVAVLLQAFLPTTAEKIFEKLGIEKDSPYRKLESITNFHTDLVDYTVHKGEALFVRLDVQKEVAYLTTPIKKEEKQDKQETAEKPLISIDDFDKVELVVGKILHSEKIAKSEKLLKNTVQIGEEVRTIVSGIAKHYQPEEIIGKNVVVVKNLKPIKLCGVESFGMILCSVSADGKLSLVEPNSSMPSGSEVC